MIAAPRGFCAGVDRAIQIVEQALQKFGAPVYVRHEIVHNRYVVESLKAKGAIFVKELDDIPETGQPVIFSAHGVAKAVPAAAQTRNLFVLDATCPLVSKVHMEAARHYEQGHEIVLVGHRGHPEVIGTMGQLPDGAVQLIETAEEARQFVPKDAGQLAYVTQTTLSVDDTAEIVTILKQRFPAISGPGEGRHLLRDYQPPACGESHCRASRGADRGRQPEKLELDAACRSRRTLGMPDVDPDRAGRPNSLEPVRWAKARRADGRGFCARSYRG